MDAAAPAGVPTVSEYWDVVELFCGRCREALRGEFVSLAVVGSLSVGDVVPGWSDIDAVLVAEAPDDRVRGTVKGLVREVTERFPWLATDRGSLFGVILASRREALEGGGEVSFLDRWDLRRHGVVACGEDLRSEVGEPPLDREWVRRHVGWMHQFLVRDGDAPRFWKARNAIAFVLSGARAAILLAGQYAKAKATVAGIFAALHPDRAPLVAGAMEARGRWPEFLRDDAAVDAMFRDAVEFLEWVRALP